MKKNNFLIFIIVILVILLAVCLEIIYKNNYLGTKSEALSSGENIISEESLKENTTEVSNVAEENAAIEEITDEERNKIEEYINEICNKGYNVKLPVFNDINNADKVWIYSQLYAEDGTNYITKQQIQNQLNKLFGSNLKVNVDVDIEENEEFVMPVHSEIYGVSGKYALPVFGTDNVTYYIIDKISKNNDNYIINVVEFNQWYDLSNDSSEKETIISSYDENSSDSWKWKEVFRFDSSKIKSSNNKKIPDSTLSSEVLKRKNEFCSYSIVVIRNENGLFNVCKVEKI